MSTLAVGTVQRILLKLNDARLATESLEFTTKLLLPTNTKHANHLALLDKIALAKTALRDARALCEGLDRE